MGKPTGKPIERQPHGAILPRGWHAMHNYGIPYRPRDTPVQEDWASVARKFGVTEKDLIYFNFLTVEPDEVNRYLHHHTGCEKISPSGNNWMFSNRAVPGIIWIPPADDQDVDYSPEKLCVWLPDDGDKFIRRLIAVAQGMSGEKGKRIKRLVQVILRAGYPGAKELWYYNDMAVAAYTDIKTTTPALRAMTSATNTAFPFDGDSGLYSQFGSPERQRGKWRIHAGRDLFDEFTCGHWDANAMKDRLGSIDELMYKGWHEMELVSAKTSQGGGSAFDPSVFDFIHHVDLLTHDDTSLYWAFQN